MYNWVTMLYSMYIKKWLKFKKKKEKKHASVYNYRSLALLG